jgi:two-component system sensor histidine kinase EvgS
LTIALLSTNSPACRPFYDFQTSPVSGFEGPMPASQIIFQSRFKQGYQILPVHKCCALVLLVSLFILATPVLASEAESTARLQLTDSERLWLEANPTVTFTGDPNWLPYEAFDSEGNYIGIVSQHLDLIAKSTGIEFRMSPSETWTESTEKAKNGQVDILSETDDSDLKSHLVFTDPYLSNPIVIAMHLRENYVEGINSIRNQTIAVIKDYGYVSKIRRKYPDINFTTVQDIQHGLIAVSTGEVDALLCTLALCSYTIANLGLNNVKITGKTEFDTKLALGVQKNLPELVSILNKAIKNISHGQQQVILDGWIKQKYIETTDYTLAYQVTAVAFILLGIFAYWNRRLSREINLRVSTEEELGAAQEVLRLSQQRLLLHREHTPLAVIEWNTDFEVLSWNPAAQRIFGFTREEVLGQHVTKHILPESARDAVDRVWKDLLENRGGRRSTNENITRDGRTILCEWYNTPLVDPNGNVIGVTSLVDDITERKQTEQELEQHRHHLEAMVAERTVALELANKELESFSYSVSHDLRAPLRSIDGFSHSLLEDYAGQLDDTGRDYLRRVRNSAQRMGRLIDAMLLLSRVMRRRIKRESIDLGAMAQAAIRKLRDYEPQREVEVDIAPGLHGWGDAHLIEIVLDNLLGNAWKYTGKTDKPRIAFGSTNDNGKIIYHVRDNGVGFDMEYADKLFESFQRLHKADEFEGTGIGLATVARIIRRHNGRVWAESEVGQGATFYFTLGEETI